MHTLTPGRHRAQNPQSRVVPTHAAKFESLSQSDHRPQPAVDFGGESATAAAFVFGKLAIYPRSSVQNLATIPESTHSPSGTAESALPNRDATATSGAPRPLLICGEGGANPGERDQDTQLSPEPSTAAPPEMDDPAATASAPGDAVLMSGTGVGRISANIGPTGLNIAHVPPCAGQPVIRLTATPAGAAPVIWSIDPGSTALVAPGTALTPARDTLTATLTLGAAQKGGVLDIKAENSDGGDMMPYRLASHPTAIASTNAVGDPTDTTLYGGVFNHQFTSHDGQVASLEEVGVGERFPNVPTPDASTHRFPTPFGPATLKTGTLPNTPSGAAGNWFLTSTGELGGNMDTVSTPKKSIDIGQHLASDSNPTPAAPMPVQFVVDQQFFWWCPHAPAGKRWAHAADTTQTHLLRRATSGAGAEFVAIVNAKENAMPYEGETGVTNARAAPATVTPSSPGVVNTVQIQADALPDGRALFFSIRGNARGCTIDHATGELTIGARTGTVKVRAANTKGGPNWDEVDVVIAASGTPAPSPAPTPPGAKLAPAPTLHGGGASSSSIDIRRTCACGVGATGADGKCPSCGGSRPVLERDPAGITAAEGRTRVPTAPIGIEKVLDSSGTALPESVRRVMEPRFGVDFGNVRIHADAAAARSARALAARAYTVGSHVVFRDGEYQPGFPGGQRLLAHELTHVVQQRGVGWGRAAGTSALRVRSDETDLIEGGLVVNQPGDRYEQEAERVAEQITRSAAVRLAGPGPAHPVQSSVSTRHRLQRQPADGPGEIEMPEDDLSQIPVVPAIVKSRRGDTGWIKDPSAGGSLDEKQWAATNRTEIKTLYSDAAKVAQADKVFVGPAAVTNATDNINIVDGSAKPRVFLPGLNFSAAQIDQGATGYVAPTGGELIDKLTPSRTDPLPKVALVLSSQALSSKNAALRVLRHEMVHVEHLTLALKTAKRWIDSKTKSSFEDWLNEEHDKRRISSLDLELSQDAANARSANTELLAYAEGFMTAFLLAQPAPGDNDDAAFVELYGMITSSAEPWANANVPARQEALGRLQEYHCHVLDQPHREAFERFVLKRRNQQTTKAPAWTWAPKRQMHDHFYAGLKAVIDAKCAPLGSPAKAKAPRPPRRR
jgi:hypothetical protein